MNQLITNKLGILHLGIVVCLAYSACATDCSTSCMCGVNTDDKTSLLEGTIQARNILTKSDHFCCKSPKDYKSEQNKHPLISCIWCNSQCECSRPSKTNLAILQKDPYDSRESVKSFDYSVLSNNLLNNYHYQIDNRLMSANPLSTNRRDLNVILCIFLC